jgi:hypothetical protein
VGSCEHGNEPSGSIRGVVFLDKLRDYWILTRESALWSQLISRFVSYNELMDCQFIPTSIPAM